MPGRLMSDNVIQAMKAWKPKHDLPMWALERASEITGATVPGTGPNMLYALPAGLSYRLTQEIAEALVETHARAAGATETGPPSGSTGSEGA